MRNDDLIRFRHMLDAAKEAIKFAKGKTKDTLSEDRMVLLSIVKSIEIIGEAASRVTQECRNVHDEIPWSEIIAMRNRLIHVYFDVDHERVWDTVKDDLPPLVKSLKKIIPSRRAKRKKAQPLLPHVKIYSNDEPLPH